MVTRTINNKILSTKDFENLYPYESKFFTTNGFKMHFIDQGKGPPVLMLHGNPTWSFYFRNVIDKLSPNFRTIVPDHIGCGLSDKPSSKDYNYTLKNRVSDISSFIEHLNLKTKITLILHDWGGMIGLAWALNHISQVDKVILTNTSGFFLPKTKKFPLRLAAIKFFIPFTKLLQL